MARFFKYIFRILLIAYAAVILALVIPPLIGYATAAVQNTTESNQAVGTVDYAERIPLEELSAGDKILVTGTDSVNVYTVQSVDTEGASVIVADASNQEIPVRSYVYRLIAAVPLIGYIVIALQSVQGVIILAAAAAVLVLFCILTGVWSRRAKEKKLEKQKAKEAEAAAEQTAQKSADGERVLNERAEAYFAARRAEQNRPAPLEEEYEDFPEKTDWEETAAPVKAVSESPVPSDGYFDEDETDDEADAWLHDDVDEDDLFTGMGSSDATESMMATARLFAINRAAQLKEQMAADDPDKTRIVAPETLAAVIATETASTEAAETENSETDAPARKKSSPVKEIAVDKVINLKELKGLDEDTQKIVLTINIKVVPE